LQGVIIDKCKILCIAEDDFNDLPSSEHLNTCEFYFSKAFNCNTLEIVGLDGVVDAIGGAVKNDNSSINLLNC
jgi:hypothetical protein